METVSQEKNKKKSYISILALICFPIFIILIAFLIILGTNYSNEKKTLKNIATSDFRSAARLSEEKINYILDLSGFVAENPALRQGLENNETDFDAKTQAELLKLKNSHDFISDVFLFNRNSNKICSTNGIFFSGTFFTDISAYEKYDQTYWHNLDSATIKDYKFLFPTKLTIADTKATVLPIIIKNPGDISSKNLIVFNLNIEKMLISDSASSAFPSFKIYIADNTEASAIASDGTLMQYKDLPADLYTNIKSSHDEAFEYTYNNTKYLVIPQESHATSKQFTYFAMVPKKNITPDITFALISIVTGIIISGIFALRSTSILFNPLYRIYTTLVGNNKSKFITGSLLNDISFHISRIQKQNETLATALPYAQEKYLINYLNATEYYIDEAARDVIADTIDFPNDFFAVVIIQITPTHKMFDLYNSFDYSNIQSGLYSVIKDMFAEHYDSFILPGDSDTLYIILNLKSKNQIMGVDFILKDMYTLLETDMAYINLSVGKSDVYEGLNGLKLAHTEAVKSLAPHVYNSDRILLEVAPSTDELNFTHKDESELFSALIAFDEKRAFSVFNSIMDKNENAPLRSKKHLFNNIANIILKAMRIKEIPLKDNKLDFEILNEILNQPYEQIRLDIESLIAHLMKNNAGSKPQTGGIDIDEIVQYIKDNYTSCDLSLEFLAEHFHTAPSNISNMIKTSLKIGYHEYLTTLRIDASKELLANTDKSITQIFKDCGFSSQQTFYRTFKKLTGLTPLEFRSKAQS